MVALAPVTEKKEVARRFSTITGVLVCLGTLAACEPSPESARGFRLPDGDPEAGRETFLALQCHACHQIDGAELPAFQGRGPVRVTLGGDVARVKTYGELVTSVINPSHRLASGYPEEEISRDGESLMIVFNEVMTVQDLMRTRFNVVQANLPLGRFIEEYLLRSAQFAWPVLDGDRLAGLITFDDVRATAEGSRDKLTVGQVMGPIDKHVQPALGGQEALEILLRMETDPLPVIDNGRVVGLLHRADIMRWLALHQLKANTT